MTDDWETRRKFLQVTGVLPMIGVAGCAGIVGIGDDDDIKDTDGDGVIDSEDYAPRDASVQRAEQVREIDTRAGGDSTRTRADRPTEPETEPETEIATRRQDRTRATPTTSAKPGPETSTAGRESTIVFGFEDPNRFDWEIVDGSRSDLAFVEDSVRGTASLYFKDSSSRVILRKKLRDPGRISEFSFWFKYRSRRDNNFRIQLFGQNEARLVEIREYGRTVHYKNSRVPGVLDNPVANVSQDAWFRVVLSNIDFDSQTLDVAVTDTNGKTIGSVNGIGFWEQADRVGSIRLVNGLHARSGQPGAADPLWIDDMRLRRSSASGDTRLEIYDDFEDGDLNNPNWEIRSHDSQNEFGIAETGHQSQHSLYLHHGGSLENFLVQSSLEQVVSPTTIAFWFQPTSEDQYTKDAFRFRNGDTDVIWFTNHRQNDGLYFRFRNGNDESDRKRIRDGAITVDIGRFVEIRFDEIDWSAGTIGAVYIDGEKTTTDAPFQNTMPGFDAIAPYSIGGGDSGFRVDDIAWK